MQSNFSISQFRAEIGIYSQFLLSSDNPLLPESMRMGFDHASVILSTAPYIALKNSAGYLCLNHIRSIQKWNKEDGSRSYIVTCGDYSASNDPIEVDFILDCW